MIYRIDVRTTEGEVDAAFRAELAAAVGNLDDHFGQLRSAARDRLGSLYSDADYPPTLRGLFGVEFDFPSVEPPEYLLRLNPQSGLNQLADQTGGFLISDTVPAPLRVESGGLAAVRLRTAEGEQVAVQVGGAVLFLTMGRVFRRLLAA